MLVMFPDCTDLEARILQLNGAVMRLAIEGFDDVAEFKLVRGHWLAEDGRPVQFLFTTEQEKAAVPAVAVMQKAGTCSAGGRCLLARISTLQMGMSA